MLALVRERDVVIEACPTSNWHTGVIPAVAAHPLPQWLRLGVRCTVNTDNTLLSAVTAPQELARVARIPGITAGDLATLVAEAHAAAFRR